MCWQDGNVVDQTHTIKPAGSEQPGGTIEFGNRLKCFGIAQFEIFDLGITRRQKRRLSGVCGGRNRLTRFNGCACGP